MLLAVDTATSDIVLQEGVESETSKAQKEQLEPAPEEQVHGVQLVAAATQRQQFVHIGHTPRRAARVPLVDPSRQDVPVHVTIVFRELAKTQPARVSRGPRDVATASRPTSGSPKHPCSSRGRGPQQDAVFLARDDCWIFFSKQEYAQYDRPAEVKLLQERGQHWKAQRIVAMAEDHCSTEDQTMTIGDPSPHAQSAQVLVGALRGDSFGQGVHRQTAHGGALQGWRRSHRHVRLMDESAASSHAKMLQNRHRPREDVWNFHRCATPRERSPRASTAPP